MKQDVARQMRDLENRCRVLTGAVLALVAFVSTYCLLLLQGQADRPAALLWPLLLALMFYLAGNLLALVWLRIIGSQMQKLVQAAEAEREHLQPPVLETPIMEEEEEEVEVIRPRRGEGAG